jgi:hypothetical protein
MKPTGYTMKIIPGVGIVKVPNHTKVSVWPNAWLFVKCAAFIAGIAFLASR